MKYTIPIDIALPRRRVIELLEDPANLDDIPPERTQWLSENEFRFTGLMRWVAPLMRGSFIKQSRQYMEDFKAFAEHGTDVREANG